MLTALQAHRVFRQPVGHYCCTLYTTTWPALLPDPWPPLKPNWVESFSLAPAACCRGIGHGLVKKLLERSNKVIATARVPQEAQQLQELAAENSHLTVAALDVSQPDSIQAFAAEVKRHTQHVDVSEPIGSNAAPAA